MSSFAVVGHDTAVDPSVRVLMVDDDEFMLDVVGELLRQAGATDVHRARDGHEALAVVDDPARRPDVVLCDLDMAGMDGIVFMRHLADRAYDGAVIVMSGSDDRILSAVSDLVREHELDLLETLSKPLDPERLFRALGRVSPAAARADSSVVTRGIEFFTAGYQGDQLTAAAVRKGLDQGCARIVVQPKIRLWDRRVVGAEALLRWHDPVRGILPPTAVIPAAEKYALIDKLTFTVYRQAVEALADWRRQGQDVTIAVNLSTLNLTALDLPERLADIAHAAGVETGCIILEITESRLMENLAASLEVIGRLRLKGFAVSIDDFGTGYASMANLKQLPFTELKIDRSFVHGALMEENDRASKVILGCSVELGHALHLSVVAEGVETQAEWSLLETLGCDEIQGYLVARPMPVDDFLAWKAAWDADPPERRAVHPAASPTWRG